MSTLTSPFPIARDLSTSVPKFITIGPAVQARCIGVEANKLTFPFSILGRIIATKTEKAFSVFVVEDVVGFTCVRVCVCVVGKEGLMPRSKN